MTTKERRVVNAFSRCVASGEMSPDYATLLMEDATRYSFLGEEARKAVYAAFPADHAEGQAAEDTGMAERLAELEEALELILSGVTDDEA